MDRNRDESRLHKDSKEKDITVKYIRPTVIREIAYIYISGDGKKFINEKEARTYQGKLMESIKPTLEQVKERVKRFLRHGDSEQVVEWILQSTDGEVYEMMWNKMQGWEDVTYRDEYDNLTELGWINED